MKKPVRKNYHIGFKAIALATSIAATSFLWWGSTKSKTAQFKFLLTRFLALLTGILLIPLKTSGLELRLPKPPN